MEQQIVQKSRLSDDKNPKYHIGNIPERFMETSLEKSFGKLLL